MAVVMTRRFKDQGGNTLYLRVQTGKRIPFILKVQHGTDTGTLATANDEAAAMERFDQLAADAEKRGWKEALGGRGGLTEIPAPSTKAAAPKAKSGGGGSKRSAPAR